MGYTVSQVATQSNVHIETVRYYEKRGLISKPPRNESGYRMFTSETIKDIQFIKRAQELGFTLEEIKQLLSLHKGENNWHTDEMLEYARIKLHEIEEKISQLNNFKSLLELAMKRPSSMLPFTKSQCPILQKCSDEES